jgi:hypothetical protein
MGDHTEALQVEFDPKVISYESLLDLFWRSHNAFRKGWSTQYQSVLWTHGKAQAVTARKSAAAWAKAKKSGDVKTPIRPATRFWIAEDYHQKYYLRGRAKLLQALVGEKATDAQIRESTLAARANGWIIGHGKPAEIAQEAKALGLDAKTRELLNKALDRRVPALCK